MGWHRLDLGDPLLHADPAHDLEQRFRQTWGETGPPLYVRHETGGVHCTVVAYLGPGAEELARELGARPCTVPARDGLCHRAGRAALDTGG